MDILAYSCQKTKGYAKEKEVSRYEEDFFSKTEYFLCDTLQFFLQSAVLVGLKYCFMT